MSPSLIHVFHSFAWVWNWWGLLKGRDRTWYIHDSCTCFEVTMICPIHAQIFFPIRLRYPHKLLRNRSHDRGHAWRVATSAHNVSWFFASQSQEKKTHKQSKISEFLGCFLFCSARRLRIFQASASQQIGVIERAGWFSQRKKNKKHRDGYSVFAHTKHTSWARTGRSTTQVPMVNARRTAKIHWKAQLGGRFTSKHFAHPSRAQLIEKEEKSKNSNHHFWFFSLCDGLYTYTLECCNEYHHLSKKAGILFA